MSDCHTCLQYDRLHDHPHIIPHWELLGLNHINGIKARTMLIPHALVKHRRCAFMRFQSDGPIEDTKLWEDAYCPVLTRDLMRCHIALGRPYFT